MDAFPAFYPLAGATVVIAGTGEAAEVKARLFAGSPAKIVRLEGARALDPSGYGGATLAFIAGGDGDFVIGAATAARAAGVPVNVVDRPDLCDFTTPALIDRGAVVAAIGTGGASPMLATMLRQDLEARLPEGLGVVATLLGGLRAEIRGAFAEFHQRRAFIRACLAGPVAQAAMSGDMARAEQLLRADLAKGPAAAGCVQYLSGDGPVDLLSLRALRALSAADALAIEAGAEPGVLALARRDAERLAPSVEGLIEMTRKGLRIVRLTRGPAPDAERRALEAAGVPVEILPVAG
jgi:precorrin-2 dehydrogenase / sirohydrochlorin ferrochelatase